MFDMEIVYTFSGDKIEEVMTAVLKNPSEMISGLVFSHAVSLYISRKDICSS